MRSVYINLDGDAWTVHPNDDGTGAMPEHSAKQFTQYELSVGFVEAGVVIAPTDVLSMKMAIKLQNRFAPPDGITDPTAPRIVNLNASSNELSGTARRYTFSSQLIGDALALDMANAGSYVYDVEIEWIASGSSVIKKSVGHELTIISAVANPADTTPVNTPVDQRIIYVDDAFERYRAQGYQAYDNLQDALDAALALDPYPAASVSPALIRLGLIASGDAEITATEATGLIFQGVSKEFSTITNFTINGDYAHELEFNGITVANFSIDGNCLIDLKSATITALDLDQCNPTITGDVFSSIGAVDATGATGANGVDADAGTTTAATPGSVGQNGCSPTFTGMLSIGSINVSGGTGGIGGDGDVSPYETPEVGGQGGAAGVATVTGIINVGSITINGGNGGVGGAATSGTTNGANGGAGGGSTSSTFGPQCYVATITTDGGSGGLGGAGFGGGSSGSAGADGDIVINPITNETGVPIIISSPGTPESGVVLYSTNGVDLKLKDQTGAVKTVTIT